MWHVNFPTNPMFIPVFLSWDGNLGGTILSPRLPQSKQTFTHACRLNSRTRSGDNNVTYIITRKTALLHDSLPARNPKTRVATQLFTPPCNQPYLLPLPTFLPYIEPTKVNYMTTIQTNLPNFLPTISVNLLKNLTINPTYFLAKNWPLIRRHTNLQLIRPISVPTPIPT